MHEEKHWNNIGASYNDEIFDVFRSDRNNRLSHYFRKHANSRGLAIDFGCGTGKSFSKLAPAFRSVLAIDISEELLVQAAHSGYTNVTCRHGDLTKRSLKLPPADFAFCCNVIMLPEMKANIQMIDNIHRSLKKGKSAILILPAMESVLLSAKRLMDWYGREGVKPSAIAEDELSYFRGSKRDIIQGLVQIDGVVTKHYTEAELQILFPDAGFKITAIEHLEYKWDSEFTNPPGWMKDPYPWDWLVECKKL